MSELKAFINLYWSTKTKGLSSKSGRGICITRLYKRHVLSLSTNKRGPIVQKSKQTRNKLKFKFKKGVGIAIKSKETSSKLAI